MKPPAPDWLPSTCPICAGTAERFLFLYDWAYTGEGPFGYLRCRQCGAVFAEERLPPEALGRYYPPNYAAYTAPSKVSWLARATKTIGMRQRRRLVECLCQGGNLLDIGCGNGDFVETMQATGRWQTSGLERDEGAVRIARARGLNIHQGQIPEVALAPNMFDIITLWDVLEHLEDPWDTLKSIIPWLRPGGFLVLRTPDAASQQARTFDQWWAGYDAPRHRIIYTSQALERLLKACGLKPKRLGGLTGTWALGVLSIQNWARAHGWPRWFIKGFQHPGGQVLGKPIAALWDAFVGGAEMVIAARRQDRP